MIEDEDSCWNIDDEKRCSEYGAWTKFPGEIDIIKIRKKMRKRKIPNFLDRNCEHDQIAWHAVSDDEDPICSWCVIGGVEKSFRLSELCRIPELERYRYEFGMLVAALCDNFGHVIRRIYGDTREVINYQGKCFKTAADFKHWAQVPAGHMIFPNDRTET